MFLMAEVRLARHQLILTLVCLFVCFSDAETFGGKGGLDGATVTCVEDPSYSGKTVGLHAMEREGGLCLCLSESVCLLSESDSTVCCVSVRSFTWFVGQNSNGEWLYQFDSDVPVNRTFQLHKDGYPITQSATLEVPLTGLSSHQDQPTLQGPNDVMFEALKLALWADTGIKVEDDKCQLVVTVCAFNKTLFDLPQGEPNSTVMIDPPIANTPYYFGTWYGRASGFDGCVGYRVVVFLLLFVSLSGVCFLAGAS